MITNSKFTSFDSSQNSLMIEKAAEAMKQTITSDLDCSLKAYRHIDNVAVGSSTEMTMKVFGKNVSSNLQS